MPMHNCPNCGKLVPSNCFGDPNDLLCSVCKLQDMGGKVTPRHFPIT